MKTRFFYALVSVLSLLVSSSVVEAKLKLTPTILDCPDARVGESVSCDYIEVKNNNSILDVNITDVYIGDDDNFTADTIDCMSARLRPHDTCNVPIAFHPESESYFDTSLVVKYSSILGRGTATADVYGAGIRPVVSLSTDAAPFGDQTINTSSWQYVTMKNIGTDVLTIYGITVPLGSAFRVNSDCGDTLDISESCLIQIFFEPIAEIDYAATVEIDDDADDSPQSIEASGRGIAAGEPDVSLDKTVVDFDRVSVGSISTGTVTVSNVGTVPLVITSIAATGTSFSQSNDCGAGLDVGASCTITTTFAPTVSGAYSGVITVNDNASDSPQTVTLSGKGVAPDATVTPDVIEFGNQTVGKLSSEREVILLNSGTSNLTIAEIGTSNTVYSQSNNCPSTLEPMTSCSIYVSFAPTETGFVGGSLTVHDDAVSGSPQTVFLFGTGITGPDVDIVPGTYDFGGVAVGSASLIRNFDVTNTGDGRLSIYSVTANSDFEQANDCPGTLEEEQSCTIGASFVPQVAGRFFGFLSINDNASGSPHKASLSGHGTSSDVRLIPASIDFGRQTVGKSSLAHNSIFQNSGNSPVSITGIETGSTVFTQTNNCGASLAPTEYCTISTTFSPAELGEISGVVTITDSASGSPHNIDLFGSGLDPAYPDVDISPNYWDFGNILVGQTSVAQEFSLKNTGVADVAIYSIDTNSQFGQDNDCPSTLAADQTCTISVTFSPQSSGSFTGHIKVIDNTPDGYQLVSLVGTATNSGDIDMSISATSLDFGDVAVKTVSDPQSVVVTNSGSADLAIGAVSLEGSQSMYFSKRTTCQGATLDVGKSCLIDVTFNPNVAGIQQALVILYDDAVGSPQSIIVTGNGVDNSGCSLTGAGGAGGLFAVILLAGVPCVILRCRRKCCQRE